MSAIMKQPGSKIPLRAHFDRQRVETVHVGRSPPHLSMRMVVKMAKIDPEKKRSPDQVDPFLERLHDETCSQCRPPSDPKVPSEWHHVPWDEVELKKHGLMDKQCHHIANALVPDEVEMKKLGMVDSEGHHNVASQMDEMEKRAAAVLDIVCAYNAGWVDSEGHHKVANKMDEREKRAAAVLELVNAFNAATLERKKRQPQTEECGQKPWAVSAATAPSWAVSAAIPPPKDNESIRPSIGAVATVNGKPIAITNMVETADGQFEFKIDVEVRFKPKMGAAEADKSPEPM